MNHLSALLINAIVEQDQRLIKIRQRVQEAAASRNDGVPPTVGKDGRLHAPHDGYEWEDNLYHGGSYLPTPADLLQAIQENKGFMFSTRNCHKNEKSVRVKSTTDTFNSIMEDLNSAQEELGIKLDMVKVTHGSVWDSNQCYIYVASTYPTLIKTLEDYAHEVKIKAFEEAKKLKGTAPTGRQQVTGKVLSIKVPSYYDHIQVTRMLVLLDNKSTVFGTVPNALLEQEVSIGDTVSFAATFTHADNDTTHSFYKRPSKPMLTKQEGSTQHA